MSSSENKDFIIIIKVNVRYSSASKICDFVYNL